MRILYLFNSFFQVTAHDGQSQSICMDCWTALKTFNQFYTAIEGIHKNWKDGQITLKTNDMTSNEALATTNDSFINRQKESTTVNKDELLMKIKTECNDDSNQYEFNKIMESDESKEKKTESRCKIECDICGEKCSTNELLEQHFRGAHRMDIGLDTHNLKKFDFQNEKNLKYKNV